jgi:hypothetical protein
MPRTAKKHRGVYVYPKGSGVWWVLYYDQFKRRHREKAGLKSAAIRIYQQRKTEIRQGKFDPENVLRKHQNVLVSEIIEDFIKASEARNRKSIDDIRQRLNYWETRLGDWPAKSILNSDIEEARLELAQQLVAALLLLARAQHCLFHFARGPKASTQEVPHEHPQWDD